MTKLPLPAYCFANHPVTGEVVKIERGKHGYIETDCGTSAGEKNISINVMPQQAEAMMKGSMYGWYSPGADPNVYQNVMKRREEG
ncbi:hypothetical protein [Virgibacillus ainsalahensis]